MRKQTKKIRSLATPKKSVSPHKEGAFRWDEIPYDPDEQETEGKTKRFKKMVVSYVKTEDPRPEDVDEIIRLADEASLDSHPIDFLPIKNDTEIPNMPTYYEWLLKGHKDGKHYLALATELYEWGYEKEALEYVNKGIGHVPSEQLKDLISLRDDIEICGEFIGADLDLRKLISKAAHSDLAILIEGETGTGKEVVARLIHRLSHRKHFEPVNCAAIPATLLESELFGHKEAAFTGAKRYVGILERANEGTVFLDEINEMTPDLQAKLLRFLQDGEIRPIGSERSIKLDVKVLCATNQNALEIMRKDFYHRIAAFKISLPPLKERKGIIRKLARHFEKKYQPGSQKPISLTEGAMSLLETYSWPGNVRELENLIRVIISTAEEEKITSGHLERYLKSSSKPFSLVTQALAERWTEEQVVDTYRKIVFEEFEKDTQKASKALGRNYSTLNRWLKKQNASE